jgi:hypothetical protein
MSRRDVVSEAQAKVYPGCDNVWVEEAPSCQAVRLSGCAAVGSRVGTGTRVPGSGLSDNGWAWSSCGEVRRHVLGVGGRGSECVMVGWGCLSHVG